VSVAQQGVSRREARRAGLRDLLPAIFLMLAGLSGLVLANIADPGAPGSAREQVLVIGRPGSSRAQMIALVIAARGRIAGFGGFANVVIGAAADSSLPDPDFKAALRFHGALVAVTSPVRFGCSGASSRRENAS